MKSATALWLRGAVCASAPVLLALMLAAAPAVAQQLAYVSHTPNEVWVIDTSDDSVVTTLTVPGGIVNNPESIAITPDGAFVYALGASPNQVLVIDTATQTVVTEVPLPSRSEALAVTPDGTRVYVTAAEGDFATVIDTATQTIVAELYQHVRGAFSIAFSPDGASAYLVYRTQLNFNVGIFDTDPGSETYHNMLAQILIPEGLPWAVTVSPNQPYAYVTSSRGGRGALHVIDLDPNSKTFRTLVASVDLDGATNGRSLAVSPNGMFAYVPMELPSAGGAVAVFDTDAKSLTFHTVVSGTSTVPLFPVGVKFTAAGDRAYLTGGCFLCHAVRVLRTDDHAMVSSAPPNLNSGGITLTPPPLK